VVKGRHEVCGDLCHFLFRYGVRRILFTSLENVFQRTAILGRASVSKQSFSLSLAQELMSEAVCTMPDSIDPPAVPV
jgi:hypothetical protein